MQMSFSSPCGSFWVLCCSWCEMWWSDLWGSLIGALETHRTTLSGEGESLVVVVVLFHYRRGGAKCKSEQQKREQQPQFLALCWGTGGKHTDKRAIYSSRYNNYHASWVYLTYIFLGWERWCPCYIMSHCCIEFCSKKVSALFLPLLVPF